MTMRIILCSVLIACLAHLGLGLNSAAAQTPLPPAAGSVQAGEIGPPSPNDVRELIRLLEDERIRNWLQESAANQSNDQTPPDEAAGKGLRDQLTAFLDRTRERGSLLRGAWSNVAAAPALLAEQWQNNLAGAGTVRSLTYVLIFLFIGGGLEWLYRQYTSRRLLKLQLSVPTSLPDRLRASVLRALLIFGGLIVFSLGSVGGFLSFDWNPFVEELVLTLLVLVIVLRTIATASMFVLAPRVRELRLAPFDSSVAKNVHVTLIGTLSVMAMALAVADIFEGLTEADNPVAGVEAAALSVSIVSGLLCLLAALAAIWLLAAVFADRGASSGEEAVRGAEVTANWRTYLSVLAIASFGLWLLAATDLMWTLLILGLLPPAFGVIRGWVNYFFGEVQYYQSGGAQAAEQAAPDRAEETHDRLPEAQAAAEPDAEAPPEGEAEEPGLHEPLRLITIRFLRFLLVIASVLIVLAAWGTDIFSLAESPTFLGRVTSVVIDLIVAVLIADLVWTWAKTAIDRRLADYKPPEGPQAPGPEARMATLLPLLRVILLVTLVVMVGLSVLSSAGVNIAPLLAGAGVLGVAIGFGAQSLVKDIVSGIFFLIDDAFRVGEYIEIGNLRGVVESISIRSLRVRHHRGAVHTIPFGELTSLTNYSRDWVIMKMEFRVPFETDIRQVKKIVKRIGAEMMEDPLYKDGFLEPLKSQGVRRMEEFNMVVGVKFMAKPGDQWIIRRDAYQKIVDAFEANGIRLAERNVKVEVVSDRPLSEEEHKAVVGAAQDSIEQQVGPPVPAPDEP